MVNMVQKYSNKTQDELAHFIETHFSHTEIDSLFLNVSVPIEFRERKHLQNKLSRALNVITSLANSDIPEHRHILNELFCETLTRCKKLFDGNHASVQSLLRALKADGYEIRNGKVVSSDSLEAELAQETSVLYERLESYSMQDVRDYLEQAHQSFIDGRPEACNAMLRTAFESTLQHSARLIADSLISIPRANPDYLTPADIRKYLVKQGFFTDDEIKYIKEFYGYASTGGPHPRISNEAEARLRRLMIVALIQYCLEKLINLKKASS